MTPGDWARVDELFQRAIEQPPDERKAFVRREAAGDATLEHEVLSLLSFDSGPESGLNQAVRSIAARVVEETEIVGERVGIYRVLRKIGEGGMGTVYLALRDDGEFRKEVAVKIVRLGMETPQFVERFRRERQILATLDHPYVARLLDGGAALLPGRTMALPYLVMEFVDGYPIHDFCKSNGLRTADRCRLFIRVCEAVSYAHRQLIVHRDLKPGNILVSADGIPKLLDFGIAQLIEFPERQDPGASRRQLTIDYASPEQVRGENAGIGTDVYSLGAVFYELLSDVRPHRFRSYSAPEVERVICQETPLLVSEVAPERAAELRGDLDAIVAKAMRKNSAERYGSVEDFRRDIDRFLTGMPVEAREGGVGYRAEKFVRRHKWAVAGGTLAVLGLAASTAMALWQANVAVQSQRRAEAASREAIEAHATEQVQRQRAEEAAELAQNRQRAAELAEAVAVAQHNEAERRFNQVRELANRLLFEYQDEVGRLPGSTAVRKKMVETGLAYFDTLAKSQNLDADVRVEMMDGWRRLGDIQGNPYASNLGDWKQALASYERGLALAEQMGEAGRKARVQLLVARGDVISASGDYARADAEYAKALQIVEGFPRPEPGAQGLILQHRGDLLEKKREMTAALAVYQRALAVSPREQHAALYQKSGTILVKLGRAKEALENFQKGLALADEALAKNNLDPARLRMRVFLLIGFADLYRIHWRELQGKQEQARLYMEMALEVQDRLRAVEPFNQQALRDSTVLEQRLAGANLVETRFDDAIRHGLRAVDSAETLIRLAPGMAENDILLAVSLERLAKPYMEVNKMAEAEALFVRVGQVLDATEKRHGTNGMILRERYYLLRELFLVAYEKAEKMKPKPDWRPVLAPLQAAIRMNEELIRREPTAAVMVSDRSELHSNLALLHADLGEMTAACTSFLDSRRFRAMDPRPQRETERLVYVDLMKRLPDCK